jgi:hypothetical protein
MAPFADVLRRELDILIFQFRGMTAGVTGGYEEVTPLTPTTPHWEKSQIYFLI